MKKDLLFFFVVLTIVLLFGAFILYAPKSSPISYRPVDVGGGAITVENQPENLTQVTLDAEVAADGWITIHESMSGAPAAIIGVSDLLSVGNHPDLVIPLREEMIPGYRYITLLHVDDGDGVFEPLQDYPVEVDGEVVRPDFVAGREPGDDSTLVDIPGTDETVILEEE